MNMEKKILKDLYCFQCSMQFDKKKLYDLHLSIIHNYIERRESFLTEIKQEPGEAEIQKESSIIPTTSERIEINDKEIVCLVIDPKPWI